jgi:hypothetical protein
MRRNWYIWGHFGAVSFGMHRRRCHRRRGAAYYWDLGQTDKQSDEVTGFPFLYCTIMGFERIIQDCVALPLE